MRVELAHLVEGRFSLTGRGRYRVRARDARIRVMRRTLLIATCKNKTAQQRTIAIIVQYLGRVFYKYRQLTLVI